MRKLVGARVKTRVQRFVAIMAVMATLAVPVGPAGSGLLGDLVDGVLDPVKDLLDPILDPILDDVSAATGIPLDQTVDGLLDGTVDSLVGTAEEILIPDDGPPLQVPDFDTLAQLSLLDPVDPVIEDILVPGVLDPAGDALAPLGDLGLPLGDFSLGEIIGTVVHALRPALEPFGLDPAAYVIVAEAPGGSTVTQDALVDVPSPVDVTGDGLGDFTVELRFLTAQPSLRVVRLPGAPSSLAARVDAILAPNGWASPERLAVGFDTAGAELPSVARATITDLGTTSGDLAAQVHVNGAGDTLAVTAAMYDQGAGGVRVTPTDVRVAFAPVPTDVTIAADGVLDGFDSGRIAITSSSPTAVDAGVTVGEGNGDSTEIAVVVDQLPGAIELGIARQGADGASVDYVASGPVDRLALRLVETTAGVVRSTEIGIEGIDATSANFAVSAADLSFDSSAPIDALTIEVIDPTGVIDRATHLRARLEGLPAAMDIDLGDGGAGLGFDALGGVLDLLEVQLTSGPDLGLDPAVDGVVFEDTSDHYAAFVRLSGLRALTLNIDDGFDATVSSSAGRRFVAAITTGDDTLRADLSSLPADVSVAVTEVPGATVPETSLVYSASSVVDTLAVNLADGTGFEANLEVLELPTAVTATISGAGVEWTASDGVPSIAVDVDDSSGLGSGISEIRARLLDVPAAFSAEIGGGTIAVDARPGVVGSLDVLASDGVATVAVPDGVNALVLAAHPDSFAAAAHVSDLEYLAFAPDPIEMTLETAVSSVFEVDIAQSGADGSATEVRATIDSLPERVTLGYSEVAGVPHIDYTASSTVENLVATVTNHTPGESPLTIDLEVHDLPAVLALTLGDDGVTYEASTAVPLLRAHISTADGLVGIATDLSLELTDLPPTLGFGISDTGELSFSSDGGVLGTLDALLTSGPELALPSGVDGVLLIDEPSEFVAAVHVTGLRSIAFDPASGTAFSLGTTGGQLFELDVRQLEEDGSQTNLRATLDRLPADVSLAFSGGGVNGFGLDYTASATMDQLRASLEQTSPGKDPTSALIEIDDLATQLAVQVSDEGDVSYQASSSVTRLALDLFSPDGLFDRANQLNLVATDLPIGIEASLDSSGGLEAVTTGGPLGSLEALITSGPTLGLAEGTDGVVMRDTADDFVVFARLTGVSALGFTAVDGGASLDLETNAARVLEVDVYTENPVEGSSSTIRATLDQLPSSVSLALTSNETGRTVTYEGSAPMDRLFGDVVLTDSDGTSSFAIEALDLPETLDLDLASTGTLGYTASAGIGQLTITGENPKGLFLRATKLQALLQDLPPSLSVLLGEDGDLGLQADGGRLGHLEVLATNGPELMPNPGVAGAVIRDTAEDFVVAFRFDDVDGISVQPDPVAIQVDTAGGDVFVVQALLDGGTLIDSGEGSVSIEAVVDSLPESVTLGFGVDGAAQNLSIYGSAPIDRVTFQLAQQSPGAAAPVTADLLIDDVPTALDLSIDVSGSVTYSASAPVPVLAIDAVDPSGLFDRATDLGLRLDDLPLGLDVGLSESGAITISTTGGKLGRLEALATTGPDNRVPAGHDGILLEDLPDRFVVSARFTDLYSGDVSQVPRPQVHLVTDGGRPFSLGLYQSAPGKPSRIPNVAYTQAELLNLPPSVDLELLDGAPGTINVAYNASDTASSLTLETNSGNRWVTEASISNPVPKWFTACQAGDSRCVDSGMSDASVGSFRFLAERHTTLDVLDCAAPLNANCTRANGTKLTHVNNLRVRSFGFEGDFYDCGLFGQQACGHLYADTLPDGVSSHISNAHTLRGQIFNKDGSTELTLNFGTNFRAADRLVKFERFPSIWPWSLDTDTSGSVSCTSGTGINIQVQVLFTLNLNGNDLLC